MTYVDPATINTAPRDPVTSDFGTAALQNPVDIAAGTTGAPRVEGRALDVFSTEGTITTNSGTISAVTDTGLTNIDRVLITGWLEADDITGTGPVIAVATYELSSDGGSSWGTGVEIARVSTAANGRERVGLSFCVDTSAHDAIRVRVTYTGSGDEAEILAQIIYLGGS
jgi:hypothetical protein